MINQAVPTGGITRKIVSIAAAMLIMLTVVVFVPAVQESASAGQAALNLDQCRNGAADDPLQSCDWVNGNLNEQNSHFVEDQSTPYRAVMTGLPVGESVDLVLEYDTKHSDVNAIDLLTHYDRLEPHDVYFGHEAETVNPIAGYGDLAGTATTYPIPTPDGEGSSAFNELSASERVMTLFGGALTGIEYDVQESLSGATASTSIRVSFVPTTETAVLAWGGHIASAETWGEGNSASGINGAPYHMRGLEWTLGNLGNTDRSLSAGAVLGHDEEMELPGLTLDKTSVTETVAAPGTVVYDFVISNTGNVALTGITLDDPMLGGDLTGSCAWPGAAQTLAVGEAATCSAEYVVTQGDIDAGTDLINVAVADSEETDPVDDTWTVKVNQDPGINFDKSSVTESVLAPGTIVYNFVISNTGNIALTGITLDDPMLGGDLTGSCVWPGASQTLAVGETAMCSAEYGVTQDDIDAGTDLVNAAFVDAEEIDPVDDTWTVKVNQNPSINVTKNADTDSITVAESVEFSIVVTNDGNVTLDDVSLSDVMAWQKASGYTDGSASLTACETLYTDAQMTTIYSGDMLVPGAALYTNCDVDLSYSDHGDGVRNTADVSGTTPGGAEVTANDSAFVGIDVPELALAIDKKVAPEGTEIGSDLFVDELFVEEGTETVTWQVTIENLSGYPLEALVFDDAKAAAAIAAFEQKIGGVNGGSFILEDGAFTFVYDAPVPEGYVNVAGVTGSDKWGRTAPRVEASARVSTYAADAQIGYLVWNDEDSDGVPDADESGIAGAIVKLTLPDGSVIETSTNADGVYGFFDLEAGTYTVELDLSSVPSPADGENTITTPWSFTIQLGESEKALTANFGVAATLPMTGFTTDWIVIAAVLFLLAGAAAIAATRRSEKGFETAA